MSPVHKLSQMGSITTNKVDYPSMLAGYGDFGAMTRIGYQVGTGSSGTVAFNNIPQTFQDLVLVCYMRFTGTSTYAALQFNGNSSSLYSRTCVYGDGASAASFRDVNGTAMNSFDGIPGSGQTSGIHSAAVTHILNYSNTSVNKTILARHATDLNGSGFSEISVGLFRSTSGITSLSVIANGTNFASTSTFALYGIKASAA